MANRRERPQKRAARGRRSSFRIKEIDLRNDRVSVQIVGEWKAGTPKRERMDRFKDLLAHADTYAEEQRHVDLLLKITPLKLEGRTLRQIAIATGGEHRSGEEGALPRARVGIAAHHPASQPTRVGPT